jgi:hypothetical protein
MSCKKWLLIAIVFLSAVLTPNSSVFLAEKDSDQQSLDPRWKLYSLGINGTKHYYDIKSITHVTQTPKSIDIIIEGKRPLRGPSRTNDELSGDFFRVWTMDILPDETPNDPKSAWKLLELDEFDCSTRRYRVMEAWSYRRDGSLGINSFGWKNIYPESVKEALFELLCSQKKLKK